MKKDEVKLEELEREIFKREAAMRALEDIHNACDEIQSIAERRVEWGLTDYTDLNVGLTAKHILYDATLKVRYIANKSVKKEFPDLNIEDEATPFDTEIDKLLGRCT